MSNNSYISVPYYQFSAFTKPIKLNLYQYKPVPNEKIHWHCPFIIIDAELINKPIKDIAIAVADDFTELDDAQFNDDELNKTETDVDTQPTQPTQPTSGKNLVNSDELSSTTQATNNTEQGQVVTTDDSIIQQTTSTTSVAQAQQGSDESPTETSEQDAAARAKEKARLDYLACQEAKPQNKPQNSPQNTPIAENSVPSTTVSTENEQVSADQNQAPQDNSVAASPTPAQTEAATSSDNHNIAAIDHTQASTDDPQTNTKHKFKNNSDNNNQFDTSVTDEIDLASNTTAYPDTTQTEVTIDTDINSLNPTGSDDNQHNEQNKDNEEDELTEEEKLKQQKEAKLESYKQFLAEQKNKVDIDYQGIRVNIEANALPSRMYFIMNALSAIIASYGLVVNSAAVVIGAMLVAMMLGPISGAALAIIDYRIPFLRKSLITVFLGAVMVMFIGFIVGSLHQDTPLSNEILSRTQPTSMDLMIALAGGTAGAYAMISPHLSVAVVGVAVATALVPPLAASGILFAHGEGSLGLGALLLALTNIIAIQFTNALVLWFTGFRRLIKDDYKTSPIIAFFRRNTVPLVLLAVIGAYLTYNFNTINKKQHFENEVNDTINEYFIDKGNVLTTIQFISRKDYQTVRAVMRGESRPSSQDAQILEQSINNLIAAEYPKYLPVRLQLRYMPVLVIESDPEHSEEISQTDIAILSND